MAYYRDYVISIHSSSKKNKSKLSTDSWCNPIPNGKCSPIRILALSYMSLINASHWHTFRIHIFLKVCLRTLAHVFSMSMNITRYILFLFSYFIYQFSHKVDGSSNWASQQEFILLKIEHTISHPYIYYSLLIFRGMTW